MTRLQKELDFRAVLVRLEQDLAAADERLVHQKRRVGEPAADNQGTSGARALLRVMERSLRLLRERRELIRGARVAQRMASDRPHP
jgi:hypothetical protein